MDDRHTFRGDKSRNAISSQRSATVREGLKNEARIKKSKQIAEYYVR